MDATALCLALAIAPLVQPRPGVSGWHMLAGPVFHHRDLQRIPPAWWYWDAALRIWRLHPGAFLAETSQQMACDHYQYVSPAAEEAVSPAAGIEATEGPSGAPR